MLVFGAQKGGRLVLLPQFWILSELFTRESWVKAHESQLAQLLC